MRTYEFYSDGEPFHATVESYEATAERLRVTPVMRLDYVPFAAQPEQPSSGRWLLIIIASFVMTAALAVVGVVLAGGAL